MCALSMSLRQFKSSAAFAIVFFVISGFYAHAHEVRPAIADVTITSKQITLDLQVNIEAFVAGIDLSAVADTDQSVNADDYDSLRALSPVQMEAEFRKFWPQMRNGLTILSGGAPLEPELEDVSILDTPDISILRDTTLKIIAALPDDGTPVTIGWDEKFGPLVLRQMGAGADAYTGFLRNGELSNEIPRTGKVEQSALSVFFNYVVAGFDHILPKGLDHILFVLGLFFLSPKLVPLLSQVTAFTLAHTVTLALGSLGIIAIAPEIVEPLIAASIVYVAVENLFSSEMKPWRLLVIFMFGLLHGLGFASVLGDFGLDNTRFVTSLIGFNIGVEFGQLTVIAIAFLLVGFWFSHKPWYRKYISNPASVLIGLVGAYWFIERVFL